MHLWARGQPDASLTLVFLLHFFTPPVEAAFLKRLITLPLRLYSLQAMSKFGSPVVADFSKNSLPGEENECTIWSQRCEFWHCYSQCEALRAPLSLSFSRYAIRTRNKECDRVTEPLLNKCWLLLVSKYPGGKPHLGVWEFPPWMTLNVSSVSHHPLLCK